MAFNQVFDFVDNLDPSFFKHIVMLCEEPEYARLVQIRFLKAGLKNQECCVYWAADNEDISLTKTSMLQNGIDVDRYMKQGILQFHWGSASLKDSESYELVSNAFGETIEKAFCSAQDHLAKRPTRIRLVGNGKRDVFSQKTVNCASEVSGQLLLEKLVQSQRYGSFEGVCTCVYWIDDIMAVIDEQWMRELLIDHDAVLFLRKFTNGIALDLTKR